MYKSSSLNIKPIGLLKTNINKCVNVELDSFKRTVGSFRLENKSGVNTYIIDSFILKDLRFSTNESTVDLSNYGSLIHNIQTNYGLALYSEYCVIPKKTNTETYDNYYSTYQTAWDDYKIDNAEEIDDNNLTINTTATSYTYTALINNPVHQVNFANMISNKKYLEIDRNNVGQYSSIDIDNLLKTNPSIKKDGITLVVEALDPKININEEIIVTVDLFVGAGFLFHFGVIKELDIVGNVEVNLYKEDVGVTSMQKIIIPIKVNLK